jgi:transposase
VATDVLGQSGRAILNDLVAGESDPTILAGHARGKMKSKRSALQESLQGSIGPHQRFLLEQQLGHIDCLDWLIARVDAEVSARLEAGAEPAPQVTVGDGPPASGTEAVARLDSIPGVGRRVAEVVVAEIGREMSRFPSADHLASWAGLTPGQHESAGKRYSGRTRKGSPALRVALVEAARAAVRTHTYLAAQFRRLAARRGGKRAAVAVAHSILVIGYHLLRNGGVYQDLGPDLFR